MIRMVLHSVLNQLLGRGKVTDITALLGSETDAMVGSRSLGVCAEVHAEGTNDESVTDVVIPEGKCVNDAKKVRSVLNLSMDSYGNIIESVDTTTQVESETEDVAGGESLESAEVHTEASRKKGVTDVVTAEGQRVSNAKKVRSVVNVSVDSDGNIIENTQVRSTISCPDVEKVCACVGMLFLEGLALSVLCIRT